jgi:hypothetical protein
MAEENDNIVEEVTDEVTEQPTEQVEEKQIDESKFQSAGDDSIIKVDLSKPPTQESEEVEQQPAEEEKVDVVEEPEVKEEIVEEQVEEQPTLQEITEEEEIEEKIEEFVTEAKETGEPLPENIQKLVDFMEDTGGDIQDYVNLNRDVSKMDDSEVLDEYYRTTKSHLTPEERSFLLEDTFGFNEDEDDPREIRKKKIALKEQVAEAKAHLDGQKSKYYEDIKAGSKLTQEQQKAIDFFNRHNKESEEQNKISEANKRKFKQRTENVFNDKFKGFDYKVGDKKFRFNVKDVEGVKTEQSDLSNFINKFVGKDSTIEDAKGYHKSLFTAMNADAIANHFYEQGKADAIKGQVARDKNINTNPRQTHSEFNASGVKFKVLGESSSDMKNRSFKIKKKN